MSPVRITIYRPAHSHFFHLFPHFPSNEWCRTPLLLSPLRTRFSRCARKRQPCVYSLRRPRPCTVNVRPPAEGDAAGLQQPVIWRIFDDQPGLSNARAFTGRPQSPERYGWIPVMALVRSHISHHIHTISVRCIKNRCGAEK